MRKMTLMKVEELHKKFRDNTDVTLKGDGYVHGDGVCEVRVTFEDKFCPQLGDRLLVMVETLPDLGDRSFSEATGDKYANFLQTRKDELDGAKIVPTRKFR